MKDQAIAKIKAEMASDNSAYVQVIGAMLIDHVQRHPAESVPAVLADGKTLKDSLEAMRSAARKKASGGFAVLTDGEGFAEVIKYYGITTGAAEAPAAPAKEFETSLDAFLD